MRPRMIVLGKPIGRLPDVMKLGESFDRDAAAILRVPANILEELGKLIVEHPGFLSRQQLREWLRERWDDSEGAKRSANYAVGLDSILRRTGATLARFFSSFEAGLEERQSFSAEERRELMRRSRLLVREASALARQWRAEAMAMETGHTLQDLQLQCSLRPLFDEARTSVTGMTPLVTLDLEVTDANGLPTFFTVQMTPGDVDDLADKVTKAQKELETLHVLLSETHMPVPQLGEEEDEEEEDRP